MGIEYLDSMVALVGNKDFIDTGIYTGNDGGINGKFQLAGPDESTERVILYLIVRHLERNLAAAQSTVEYTKPLEIRLQKGITLYGQIRGAYGKPVANAKVYPNVLGHGYDGGFGYTKFPRADEKGFYKIKAMPAGLSYKLNVSAPGFESNPVELGKLDGTDDRKTDIILLRKAGTRLPVNLPGGFGGIDPENPLSFRPGQDPTEGKMQIAIETRILLVDENFLEDIGLDIEGRAKADGKPPFDPALVGVAGKPLGRSLDDQEVKFMIRATQMHANSKTLTAPKIVILDKDIGRIRVTKDESYTSGYKEPVVPSGKPEPVIEDISTGIDLKITPTITEDGKYVDMKIDFEYSNVFDRLKLMYKDKYPYEELPMNTAKIKSRVMVPDKGTVCLGGMKITTVKEVESGVPILKDIPILGRFFSSRSEVKDRQVLLMLVKPTIIKGTTVPANPVPLVEVVRGAI